ncbi:MAG: leucyl/phenylalanyl-tRNA--protein transferase [Gammaproteobacteria bacterium]
MVLTVLDATPGEDPFPPLSEALEEPDGLLAIGGNLSPRLLLTAYRQGIFPWFSDGQPILWWSPDPRAVLFPEKLHVSRSLRKTLRRGLYRVTMNRCFSAVITGCANSRRDHEGTWITEEMQQAYERLAEMGFAHSLEVWQESELVGGLYGVALGRVFFGESMFSRRRDASKVALVALTKAMVEGGYRLIDCQLYSSHLESLGAELIPRSQFATLIGQWTAEDPELPFSARCGDLSA